MEENVDYNLQIAKEIWKVLRTAPNILMSWGLDPDTVGVVETGLKFHVQGFKHTGTVEIKLNEGADLYEIYLYEESGEMKESHTDIYVDQLVDTIDRAVEYTGSDYEKKVNETYPGLHNTALFQHYNCRRDDDQECSMRPLVSLCSPWQE